MGADGRIATDMVLVAMVAGVWKSEGSDGDCGIRASII